VGKFVKSMSAAAEQQKFSGGSRVDYKKQMLRFLFDETRYSRSDRVLVYIGRNVANLCKCKVQV